jgi:preprotein translocase subunit Sec61beta
LVRVFHLSIGREDYVSKKKKEKSSPMPAASAGLLRFFEEETEGVKVRPEILVVAAVALVIVCVLAQIFFK